MLDEQAIGDTYDQIYELLAALLGPHPTPAKRAQIAQIAREVAGDVEIDIFGDWPYVTLAA
jgi:hypothetical protein